MEQLYDVIIVGAGPAGLSAALYMARAKYRVLLLEQEKIGGQITITSQVVNYPGVYETSGSALTQTMYQQAQAFGAELKMAQVTGLEIEGNIKKIHTNQGEFQCLGIILAMGANPRKLGFQGEEEFQGRGVAYCATCDGEFFKGMEVYVVGGGFAAVEEGIFLTKYASHVHIIVRKDQFSCAKTVSDQALSHPKVTVHFHTQVEKVQGEGVVTSLTLLHNKTGEKEEIAPKNGLGVFIFAGYVPNTKWIPPEIQLEGGYILTDPHGKTTVDGIYAAGDLRIKELRQVVTAVSDGATAATSLEKYVESLHQSMGLPPLMPDGPAQDRPAPSPEATSQSHGGHAGPEDGKFLSGDLVDQVQSVLAQFPKPIKLRAHLGEGELAQELASFLGEWKDLSPNVLCETEKSQDSTSYLELCQEDGQSSGMRYYTVPGGHEFNSFLGGMYQLSGGKPLEANLAQRISQLKPQNLQVFITLSCTMCPDVVQACQRLALGNPGINTSVLDIAHAPELREQYKIMSVPCLVTQDQQVHFGKKQLEEIIDLLESAT